MKGSITFRGSGGRVPLLCCGACLLAVCALVGPAGAQIYTLSNFNSTAAINVGGGGGAAGMNSWLVDGFSQVKQQWFYYRIGDSGPNQSIDSMGNLSVTPQTTANSLTLQYSSLTSPAYAARVTYTLNGGSAGSGLSGITEQINFYNNSTSSLLLRFFDYSDFDLTDLTGNTGNQSVTNYASNLNRKGNMIQTMGSFGLTNTATFGTATIAHLEANIFSSTLQSLTNGGPTGLSNLPAAGPGDVTSAMEWDVSIAAGSSLQITSLINLAVPEPSAFALIGLGAVAWAAFRAKRGRMGSASREK